MIIPLSISWSAVHAALVAVSLLSGLLSWAVLRLHQRLNTLEEGDEEAVTALFGQDENPLHVGLAREVAEIKDEISDVKDSIDNSSKERRELRKRLNDAEKKLDRILRQLEDD